MNLQERNVYLQSWWVASELIRRHPNLVLAETHPGDGLHDCLSVLSHEGHDQLHILLNRTGRMHIQSQLSSRFDRTQWGVRYPVEWLTELEQSDRRLIPRFLEDAAGLVPPAHTPKTTPKSLTFRLIYHLLLFALNEPAHWDVRNVQDDYNGIEAVYKNELFQQIKSAWVALHQSPPQGWTFGNPGYDFWEVKSAHTRVGLFQIDGTLHRPNAHPVNLMNIYNENKRDILPTAMEVRKLLSS